MRPVSPFSRNNRKSKSQAGKRNVVWFNPPYSDSVKTNIGKEFFRLLSPHFPSHHTLRKICNKNSVKLSYSCVPNVATIISSHNKVLLRKETTQTDLLPCNSLDKSNCPLDSRCRKKSFVYKATEMRWCTMDYVKPSSNPVIIIIYSYSNTDIKQAPPNYQNIFGDVRRRNEPHSQLGNCSSRPIAPAYNSGNCVCQTCLEEKYQILILNCANTLHKRSEIINKCQHRAKFKLKNIKHKTI